MEPEIEPNVWLCLRTPILYIFYISRKYIEYKNLQSTMHFDYEFVLLKLVPWTLYSMLNTHQRICGILLWTSFSKHFRIVVSFNNSGLIYNSSPHFQKKKKKSLIFKNKTKLWQNLNVIKVHDRKWFQKCNQSIHVNIQIKSHTKD